MILAIDTSAGQCAAALLAIDGEVLGHRAEMMQRGHAEALFPLLDRLLEGAGTAYSGISGIAVCTGPGSFTGIRVGVAAARGLALGRGLTAHGIDRFRALMLGHETGHQQEVPGAAFAIALAGPRDTAYFQTLGPDGKPCAPAAEPGHFPLDELDALAGDGFLRLGDGWSSARENAGLADPRLIGGALLSCPGIFGPARPFYLRDPGAAPPREKPPILLDA